MKRALLLIAMMALAATAVWAEEPEPWPADLTGVWNLDEDASDDLAAQLKALREKMMSQRGRGGGMGGRGGGMGGRGGGMGGRGGGMGGRGGGMGGGPGGGQRSSGDNDDSRPGDDLTQAVQQLLISQLDESLEIVDGAERTSLWTPDGKTYRTRMPRGEATTRAWWDGDVLVLETSDPMRTMEQRLQLIDAKRMQVVHTVTMKDGSKVEGTLVYRGA